ncbi:MAG TPA: cupin domain-containing protein [Gaiellaceae bacterium]|nr:cupin domain-containing protein [Gaiellaceae bacterium]
MKRFSLYSYEWEHERERDGYRWRATSIGQAIGASLVGATLYELPPGEKSFPYHYEWGNEEWLLVVAGLPTLRTPEGEHELEAGDVVCFPEGPEGAHQVLNATEEPVRIVFLSTKRFPAVALYPDSDKLGIWLAGEGKQDSLIVRRDSAVDYWEGED